MCVRYLHHFYNAHVHCSFLIGYKWFDTPSVSKGHKSVIITVFYDPAKAQDSDTFTDKEIEDMFHQRVKISPDDAAKDDEELAVDVEDLAIDDSDAASDDDDDNPVLPKGSIIPRGKRSD